MGKLIDFTGTRQGKLTVIGREPNRAGRPSWVVTCDCGTTKTISAGALRQGTKSCGCLQREVVGNQFRKHGHSRSKEYRAWCDMKSRCDNPNNTRFKHYGERGITYCERWKSFEAFLADMGAAPNKYTLEREDVNGIYEPSNCVWATQQTQVQNRRVCVWITIKGEKLSLKQACVRYGISYSSVISIASRDKVPAKSVFHDLRKGRRATRQKTSK